MNRLDRHSGLMCLAVSAMIEACRGDLESAEAHLEIARPLIANAIDTQLILPYAEARAELALAGDKTRGAGRRAGRHLALGATRRVAT